MQTQPQVTFLDMPADDAVREAVFTHIDQLERFSGRITGCHVVLTQPHRRSRSGRLYSVRIDLVVPGGEIVVNRNHRRDHAHEDVLVALRDSFLAVRRRLEDHVRRQRGSEKAHVGRQRGRIARFDPRGGYGFIETPDGREIYFHQHALASRDSQRTAVGRAVFFNEEEGDDGPQASVVQFVRPARRRPHPAKPPEETPPCP